MTRDQTVAIQSVIADLTRTVERTYLQGDYQTGREIRKMAYRLHDIITEFEVADEVAFQYKVPIPNELIEIKFVKSLSEPEQETP